jgi:transposase
LTIGTRNPVEAAAGSLSGTPEHLCSYAGLVPSVHQSGNSRYYGHIAKQGRSLLRWVMQECQWAHLREETYIIAPLPP